jgi:ABC-2 type transport system permease protein
VSVAISLRAEGLAHAAHRHLRLLRTAFIYELRKVAAFRVGFLTREVLRGVERCAVMIFVYVALFHSSGRATLRGYTLEGMVQYMLLVAVFQKLLFHERAMDVADQIFEGTITKFMIMPVRYFTLVLARWLQFTALQGTIAALAWTAGALFARRWWPHPASALAAAEAILLVVLGSYCFLLIYFLLNACAFWLDRVWTLLAMTRMVSGFAMGEMVPVTLMPKPLVTAFRLAFPYWSLNGPIEILMGRQGSADFAFGLAVLAAWAIGLQVACAFAWRRGLLRYGGVGA